MAQAPEPVERYVCMECQLTYAGTPEEAPGGGHTWSEPDECVVCGGNEFAEIESYPHVAMTR